MKKKGDFTVRFHFIKLCLAGPSEKKNHPYLLLFPVLSLFISLELVFIPSKITLLIFFLFFTPVIPDLPQTLFISLPFSLLTGRAIVPSPRHPLHSHGMIYLGCRSVAHPAYHARAPQGLPMTSRRGQAFIRADHTGAAFCPFTLPWDSWLYSSTLNCCGVLSSHPQLLLRLPFCALLLLLL